MSAINFPLTRDISNAANEVSSQNAEQLPTGGSGQSGVLRPDTVTLSAVFPPAPPVDAANFVQFQSPAPPALEAFPPAAGSNRELAGAARVRAEHDGARDPQSAGAASAAQPSARTAWHQSSEHQSRQSPCADQIGERSSGAFESGSHARRAQPDSDEYADQRAQREQSLEPGPDRNSTTSPSSERISSPASNCIDCSASKLKSAGGVRVRVHFLGGRRGGAIVLSPS